MRKQMNRKKTPPEGRTDGVDEGKDNSDDKFEAFERWLRTNGAQFPLLELRQYDSPSSSSGGVGGGDYEGGTTDDENEEKKDGTPDDDGTPDGADNAKGPHGDDGSGEMRGVHARTAIPPQTVCVSIPRSCLITVEMGQATPIGRRVLASDLELDAVSFLSSSFRAGTSCVNISCINLLFVLISPMTTNNVTVILGGGLMNEIRETLAPMKKPSTTPLTRDICNVSTTCTLHEYSRSTYS